MTIGSLSLRSMGNSAVCSTFFGRIAASPFMKSMLDFMLGESTSVCISRIWSVAISVLTAVLGQ